MKRLTTEQFIEKAKLIHKDTYDYSFCSYINSRTKIRISCKIHGIFEQRPSDHLYGNVGCPKCANNNIPTTKKFIKTAKSIHGNKYDYELVNYINSQTNVEIICPEHGIFQQTPNNHLRSKGCIYCGIKNTSDKNRVIPKELSSITQKVRENISKSFKRKNYTKKSRTFEILGCTWEEFKVHLEDNPYRFTIDQKDMDLDHIVPVSNAKTEKELIKLNHYTNFQLLPKDYNRWIKSCNLFDREKFEDWLSNVELI